METARTRIRAFSEGRYRVERPLGRGGMAAVYLARDTELDRPVAIKVLGEPLALDAAFVERFRREARTAAQLSHANIVQVYDTGEEHGALFIVMEYVEGEGLDALLERERKVRPERVLELGAQVCSALHYAHGKGVVHRDVKPGNLLLRTDGVLKVADFGIARPAHGTQLTEAGSILGTAAYLAPEQVRGEESSPRSDIYSLGVVLYELLTGRPPYRVESLAQLAVAAEEAARPVRELEPAVPPALEAAVMRCLAATPDDRPASAEELAAELGADVRTGTVTAPAEGAAAESDRVTVPLERPATPSSERVTRGRTRRPPRPVLALLAAALVVLALGIAFATTRADDDADAGNGAPARVEPVQPGENAREQAENLAEWIREHSAGS